MRAAAAAALVTARAALASAGSLKARQATTYDEISISGGVAGNAAEEAIQALGGIPGDFAALSEAELDFFSAVNSICNDAETDAFNVAIEAANGEEAAALERGKTKNKVLKIQATSFRLEAEAAQGQDVAAEIEEETTKLNNISQDEEEAGNELTFLSFDAAIE